MRTDAGSALLIALVVALLTVMLVGTLFAVVAADARQSNALQDAEAAFFAAESGISESVVELNTAADLDGNLDVGTIGTPGAPRSLPGGGEYYVTLTPEGLGFVAEATSAFPAFGSPGSVEVVVRALLAADIPLPGGEAAISIAGAAPSEVEFEIGGDGRPAQVRINGLPGQVPAIVVQDPGAYDAVMQAVYDQLGASPGPVLKGNPDVTYTTAAGDTLTAPIAEQSSLRFDIDVMMAVHDGLIAGAADLATQASRVVTRDVTTNQSWGTPAAPEVTVINADDVDIRGATITGAGTLIVYGDLDVEAGSNLHWQGDIIVIGDGRGDGEAELDLDGGNITLQGNLALLAAGGEEAELEIDDSDSGNRGRAPGSLTVNGAVLAIAGAGGEEAEIEAEDRSTVNIHGLVLLAGDEAELEIDADDDGSQTGVFNLVGQLAIGIGSATGEESELELELEGNTNITFNRNRVNDAVNGLAALFNALLPEPPVYGVSGWVRVQ